MANEPNETNDQLYQKWKSQRKDGSNSYQTFLKDREAILRKFKKNSRTTVIVETLDRQFIPLNALTPDDRRSLATETLKL